MIYISDPHPHKQPFLVHLAKALYCGFCLITGITCAFTQQWAYLYICICSAPLAYFFEINKSTILFGMLLFATGYARLYFIELQHVTILEHINDYSIIKGHIECIEKASHQQYSGTVLVTINAYYHQGAWQPLEHPWKLLCYTKKEFTGLVDDVILLQNFKYKMPDNKGSFVHFLMKENIHATLFLNKDNYQIISQPTGSWQRPTQRLKYRILEGIAKKCSPLTTTLVASIFLGNKLYVKKQYQHIKQLFADWGILHFLARSGLHMVMFVFFLQYFLRLLPLSFAIKQLLLLALSGIYMILSWQSISFSRAILTLSWYKLCQLHQLQTNTVHIVILLTCAFLLYNPLLLFFLDFQLSFGITLVLAITNHYLFT